MFGFFVIPGTGDRVTDIQVIPIDLDFDKSVDKKEVSFLNFNKAHRRLWLGYSTKNLTRELMFGGKAQIILFCSEKPVACISQTRDDVAV